jgi:hypothetical protein
VTTLFDPTPYQSVQDLPAMAELDSELDRLAYLYVMGADSPDIARSNLNAVGNWLAARFDELAEPAHECDDWHDGDCSVCDVRNVPIDGAGRCVFCPLPSAIVLDFRH